MTYHAEPPAPDDMCEECGEPATVVYVADSYEPGTGYVDVAAFCDKHDKGLDVQP